jgi:putative Mn2+ efflux pump MntP
VKTISGFRGGRQGRKPIITRTQADAWRASGERIAYNRRMDVGSLVLLAVGLAMDAAAVSAARGLLLTHIQLRHVVLVALFFGGFQALMPALGYALGASVGRWIAAWDHWAVFVLLGGLGIRMLHEAFAHAPEQPAARSGGDPFALPVLVTLAVATSIDALAAGITLPLLQAPLISSCATIGVITALLSVAGLYVGRHFGGALGRRLDVAGGLALIALGTKTLIEHLWQR